MIHSFDIEDAINARKIANSKFNFHILHGVKRLWSDMANDPKWRTIARKSNQRIGDVISVYIHMMTSASNSTERGKTQGWSDEDVATALDIDTSDVCAIREAMQGRVLDGNYLTGWEKRQPKREDDSSSRGKKWRESSKLNSENEEKTQTNANERKSVVDTDTDKKREDIKDIPASFDARMFLANNGATFKYIDDWFKVRKTKKAANTETAMKMFCKEVEKSGILIDQALEMCIVGNWQSFKADWVKGKVIPSAKVEDGRPPSPNPDWVWRYEKWMPKSIASTLAAATWESEEERNKRLAREGSQ